MIKKYQKKREKKKVYPPQQICFTKKQSKSWFPNWDIYQTIIFVYRYTPNYYYYINFVIY